MSLRFRRPFACRVSLREIQALLRAEHLGLSDALTETYGVSVRSLVAVLTTMVAQAAALEGEVERCFVRHPDAEIITSQPGVGGVLGARVLELSTGG